MSLMTTALTARINERRRHVGDLVRRRDELSRQIEVANIELRAYEEALSLLGAEVSPDNRATGTPTLPLKEQNAPREGGTVSYAVSRMSERWFPLFRELQRRMPRTMTNKEMKELFSDSGQPIDDQYLRSSLYKFTERGWLTRVAVGQYTITDLGIRALNFKKAREDGAENDSSGGAIISPLPKE